MTRRKTSPRLSTLGVWSVVMGCCVIAWKVLAAPAAPSSFSIAEGREYEFTLLAHPYGEFSAWWAEAQGALEESGAHDVVVTSRTEADVVLRFVKKAPLTTTLLPHTVLYPSTPTLATATLIDASPASAKASNSAVLPLGSNLS